MTREQNDKPSCLLRVVAIIAILLTLITASQFGWKIDDADTYKTDHTAITENAP